VFGEIQKNPGRSAPKVPWFYASPDECSGFGGVENRQSSTSWAPGERQNFHQGNFDKQFGSRRSNRCDDSNTNNQASSIRRLKMGFFFNRGASDKAQNKGPASPNSFNNANDRNQYNAGREAQKRREQEQQQQQNKKK